LACVNARQHGGATSAFGAPLECQPHNTDDGAAYPVSQKITACDRRTVSRNAGFRRMFRTARRGRWRLRPSDPIADSTVRD
jgi:hypothetical protein